MSRFTHHDQSKDWVQGQRKLAILLSFIAMSIALFVAFAAPFAYFNLSKETEQKESAIAARLHSAFITFAIGNSPQDWQKQIVGLVQSDLAPSLLPESREVFDNNGKILDRFGPDLKNEFVVQTSVDLYSTEGVVGHVKVVRSLRPLINKTFLIGLLASILGFAIYASLKILPLRALRNTLERLKKTEVKALEEAEENLTIVFRNALDGIVLFAPNGDIKAVNASVTRMLGYPEDQLVETHISRLFSLADFNQRAQDKQMASKLTGSTATEFASEQYDTFANRMDGQSLPVEITISNTHAMGQEQRIAIIRDITERQEAQSRLKRLASFDSLTSLPNRSMFRERLQLAIERSEFTQTLNAVMFLDLDRFKTINDSLGHAFGDKLLIEVSKALNACLRESDFVARDAKSADDLGVYRLGGDEFTVLIQGLPARTDVEIIAKRILQRLSQPFQIDGHQLFISVSIGITLFPQADTGLDALIKQADLAMYRSKALGRDTFTLFSEALFDTTADQLTLETQLRHAVERKEFRLVYQPKANVDNGSISGVEALIRWDHPDGNVISPDDFIPILEETGLIIPVGIWVIRQACEQLMRWRKDGIIGLTMAVNLSARQFRQHDLIAQIAQIIQDTGIPNGCLEVELTESSLIEDTDAVVRIMDSLAKMHVNVAIDDFGTGHSSLRYLKRFDVDTLKIDRSFIRDIPQDNDDKEIAIAVVALARGMGMRVVAEGVETPAQLKFLQNVGCDEMQGYLLSRPLHSDDFADWFNENLKNGRLIATQALSKITT